MLFCSIFQMSNMAMSESEIVELFPKIQQQEHENAALEKMQLELQVRLEEDEKHIAGKLAILRKWLYDEEEKAKNLRGNISNLQIKRQEFQEQEHMTNLVLIIGFYSSQLIGLTLSCFDVYWYSYWLNIICCSTLMFVPLFVSKNVICFFEDVRSRRR